jgi:hypothetical protein
VKVFGNGRAALVEDGATAEKLGWGARRRSRPEPEVLLRPRGGDPRWEPWIVPGWCEPSVSLEALRTRSRRSHWSYLPAAPGVVRYLERLAAPAAERPGRCVALAGLGRVGGVAATMLAVTPSRVSGIRELLIYDVDAANQERWLMELGSIARWRSRDALPRVHPAGIAEVFSRCDVFLFAASEGVPPLDSQADVRIVQFSPNRAILRAFVEQAKAAGYTGLFLVVSDPVELLAQTVFHDSNRSASGTFSGEGLAPESVAGLGLGVMWARSLACARREGWEQAVAQSGVAYGPHSAEVVVFDDVRNPNRRRSEDLTAAARECNVLIRNLGHLPYVGPGVSSVGVTLPALLGGEEILASVFVGGIYFGAPARRDWGLYPTGRPMAAEVWHAVGEAHARLRKQAASHGLTW